MPSRYGERQQAPPRHRIPSASELVADAAAPLARGARARVWATFRFPSGPPQSELARAFCDVGQVARPRHGATGRMAMQRRGWVGVSGLAALLGAGVLAASGGAQQPGEQTFTLTVREGSEGFVDNPPRGSRQRPRISAGDEVVFTQRAFDAANTRVGTVYVHCIAVTGGTEARATFHCDGNYVLRDGAIAVSAAFRGRQGGNLTISVTGGTGAYEGARGSVNSREVARNATQDTVHLLP
jgi:hypothetical protein